MIVGASPETDGQILRLTQFMYRKYDLKRVYYSSYVPVVNDPLLPDEQAGLLREHRLYQADWLLRFYGFTCEEILPEGENSPPNTTPNAPGRCAIRSFFPWRSTARAWKSCCACRASAPRGRIRSSPPAGTPD